MEVRPADLGERWQIAIVRLRSGKESDATHAPRLGRLGRQWIRGQGISETVAGQTLPASGGMVLGSSYGGILGGASWIPLSLLLAGIGTHNPALAGTAGMSAAGIGWLAFVGVPRRIVSWLHNHPLNAAEIRKLRERTVKTRHFPVNQTDLFSLFGNQLLSLFFAPPKTPSHDETVLEDDFLALVGDIMTTQVYSQEAEAELRQTLNLLGSAISDLPARPEMQDIDTSDLVADAEILLTRSRLESDRIIAESLIRQAEAKAAEARAVYDARKIARRTRILREELRAQVAATRAALPSLAKSAPSPAALRRVASSVQAVTREAASVVAACEELAAALGENVTVRPAASVTQPAATAESPQAARWKAAQTETGARLRIGRR